MPIHHGVVDISLFPYNSSHEGGVLARIQTRKMRLIFVDWCTGETRFWAMRECWGRRSFGLQLRADLSQKAFSKQASLVLSLIVCNY